MFWAFGHAFYLNLGSSTTQDICLCERLKELAPVNVYNIVASQGTVRIATRVFSEKSVGMGAGGVPEGAQCRVLADPAWQHTVGSQRSHRVSLRKGLAAPWKVPKTTTPVSCTCSVGKEPSGIPPGMLRTVENEPM